jgi:hypothetical protein
MLDLQGPFTLRRAVPLYELYIRRERVLLRIPGQDDDLVPLETEEPDDRGSDETGAAGDDDVNTNSFPSFMRIGFFRSDPGDAPRTRPVESLYIAEKILRGIA